MGSGPIVVGGFETVGLQDVSAYPRGEGLWGRSTGHRIVGVVAVHVTLAGARVVIMAGVYFIPVTMLVARTIVMGRMGLMAVAIIEAGLVFVTLIVVLMVGCVLVMD